MVASWNALYWDDWIVYQDGSTGVRQFWQDFDRGRGTSPFRGQVEGYLISAGPWLLRTLVFLIFPIIASLFGSLLRRADLLRKEEISPVVLFVLFLPMFGARTALITFSYSLHLLFFVLGARLLFTRRVVLHLCALSLIFWSMFIASFQVFVIVLIALVAWRLNSRGFAPRYRSAIVMVSLATFPFIHRYVLPQILSIGQVRDSYNEIQIAFALRALLVGFTLCLPLLICMIRQNLGYVPTRESWVASSGLAVLAAGTFPYLAVGHFANLSDWILPLLPDESEWNSRHQLLQPFGVALVLLSLSKLLRISSRSFVGAILALFVGLNAVTYSGYYLDSLKQRETIAIASELKSELTDARAVVVDDQALRFNARGRSIRDYEWERMIERATKIDLDVGSFGVDFCTIARPNKTMAIFADRGRLKALVTRRVGVSLKIQDIDICN